MHQYEHEMCGERWGMKRKLKSQECNDKSEETRQYEYKQIKRL